MFSSIAINGYRGLSQFRMNDLGRVNLLVGKNNGGKTSVLEMLYLLGSGGDPGIFWRMVTRRGERTFVEVQGGSRPPEVEYDITHLFHGHKLSTRSTFSVAAANRNPINVFCGLVEAKPDKSEHLPGIVSEPEGLTSPQYYLTIVGSNPGTSSALPLTRRLGLKFDSIEVRRPRGGVFETGAQTTQFISTESLSSDTLAALWNQIALTDAEARVLKALQFVEPRLEAIAPQVVTTPYYVGGSRGGFIVRLRGIDGPVPIGSLGDGAWRMLSLAMALSRAKDGVLLVDEIDTGLHYSVMDQMWKLIGEAARDLNIQVFATTHSQDCVRSLAAICHADNDAADSVTIQRIESGDRDAVAYSAAEIYQAALHHIEMR